MQAALPALHAALAGPGVAVLAAPPGSGKTTAVPPALLEAPWLAGRRIVMLEPRRLAARAAAMRMADVAGEPVGATFGYATRFERKGGPATRVEVVTEGILTRRLLHDPELAGVGLVVFDEFHERSLDGDLALALCLEVREALRPDLRLLVMSATLDVAGLMELLGPVPVVRAEGRMFPVETRWLGAEAGAPLERRVAEAVGRALAETPRDVLVFLPGMAEIRRAERELLQRWRDRAVDVLPLHGELSRAEQDQAIRPAPPGRRKVVLASAVAETSLTIEGITAVVDSGLARRERWSPGTGMSRLVTIPAGRANAEQRRGRAGRLAPGICYRLWSEAEERGRPAFLPPEIEEADLAPLALDLAVWGVRDPGALRWPTPPPAAAFARAVELLQRLRALDATGGPTAQGRAMAALPVHPRLAHMLLGARELGLAGTGAALAALLSARDPWRGDGADLAPRLGRLRQGGLPPELEAVHRQLRRLVRADDAVDATAAGRLLALAFPDRLAQRRGPPGSFRLATGRGAALDPADPLAESAWLVVADLDDAGADARIRLAAALAPEDIAEVAADRLRTVDEVTWDRRGGSVVARRRTLLDALVLHERPLDSPDPASVAAALAAGVRELGLDRLAWTDHALGLRQRVAFLRRHDPDGDWPDLGDEALLSALPAWLEVFPARRPEAIDVGAWLEHLIGHHGLRRLDAEAPTHVEVPSGSRRPVDYAVDPPVLAVRLQEVFGLARTPCVNRGRTPLMLHLLSPAQRPVQVTQDLAGFWARAYPEVRKELRGRYPRHHWPDDPLTAAPTARAKPR
ncbi:MAG: ATP-dependent helicase HrpB [Geminicoccaceae bacterium]